MKFTGVTILLAFNGRILENY